MATAAAQYLKTFFEEKDLPYVAWELPGPKGTPNHLDNEVVIEAIHAAPEPEKKGIAAMIRRIDFANGDVNDYLKHLAGALTMDM